MGGTISHVAITKHKTFYTVMENYFCGVKNWTSDHASVIAQRPITLA